LDTNDVENFLQTKQRYTQYALMNSTMGTHEKIARFLQGIDYITGQIYKDFKDERRMADYDLGMQFFNHTDTKAKIDQMANFVPVIKALSI
jgi:hypothetical protein